MEAKKIKGEAKSLRLENGVELTYCELGAENEETLLCGSFAFITLMPVMKILAERFHVYGVIMRFDGEGDQRDKDGNINWTRQWGKDLYDFARKMDLSKFHYFGKCHGSVPGWYLAKEHPEMLLSFASFFLAPHTCPQNSNQWFDVLKNEGVEAMLSAAMRNPKEGTPAKMEEVAASGTVDTRIIAEYAGNFAKYLWASKKDCVQALADMEIPIGYLFGTEDLFFDDHFNSNLFAIRNTKGARTVILGGERHLMEIDCPDRVASEVLMFIEESRKAY